jgi:Ca-activated chloride channel family protein
MTFLWPGFLTVLALIPVLIAFYIWVLRRRRRFAVRYSSLSLVRDVLPRHSALRRHLPFGLFMIALVSLMVALSRPVTFVTVPTGQATIILAIDVSRSMCSTDIPPSRLQALESVVSAYIRDQKPDTAIGIVAFSEFAELIQPPTTDKDVLQKAVQSLLTGGRTAIGSAILKSLDAIAEIDKTVAPSVPEPSKQDPSEPLPRGSFAPDVIVLLTDGVSNTSTDPLVSAQQAADRGVRVYTIGFGTANGTAFASCQSSDPSSGFSGFGGFSGGGMGGSLHRGIDEVTLKRIADMTGGTYYPASSAGELENVFNHLPTYKVLKREASELSVFFAAGGVLLAVLAIGLSLAWHPLP